MSAHLANLDRFMVAYEAALRAAIVETPERYSYAAGDLERVLLRMRTAMEHAADVGRPSGAGWPCKSPNIDRACRTVGIKATWKALGPFLRGEP